MKLKGKDYLPVQGRMVWYRDENKENTKVRVMDKQLDLTKGFAYFELEVTDAKGNVEIGVGSETSKDFGDFIEKAYTKAYGRALAALGYGTQFAPEFDEGERIVDAPMMKGAAPTEPVKQQAAAPAGNGNANMITKDQMQTIARLMKDAGIDSAGMRALTKQMFDKEQSVLLTEEEASLLIDTLNSKSIQ